MRNPLSRPASQPTRLDGRHAGPMARPRRWRYRPTLALALVGAVAAGALTQVATLSYRVVETRRQIGELRQKKAFLEADLGRLEAAWNQACTRDEIVPRAERELGLVAAQQPQLVLVVAGAPQADDTAWRRVLDTVGRGADLVPPATAGERQP